MGHERANRTDASKCTEICADLANKRQEFKVLSSKYHLRMTSHERKKGKKKKNCTSPASGTQFTNEICFNLRRL